MDDIRFRQPLFYKGKFNRWHYWGFVNGKDHGFTSPQNHQAKNYQYVRQDIDGTCMYEGDITERDPYSDIEIIQVVEWDDLSHSFKGCHGKNVIVIGNVYENPELIDAK